MESKVILINANWQFEINLRTSKEEQLPADKQLQRPEATADSISTISQKARRSQRFRTLTEKGQELHNEHAKKAAYRFSVRYQKWKAVTKDAKRAINNECLNDLLQEYTSEVTKAFKEVNAAYVELRRIDFPDNETRRKIDTFEAVTKEITEGAVKNLSKAVL